MELSVIRRPQRRAALRSGVRIEIVTIVWMVIEATVAIGAGIVARSILLTAFGLDSVIELVSGGVLLWRLTVESRGGTLVRVERAERRASWTTGIALVVLCVYVVVAPPVTLLAGVHADGSPVGVVLAAVTLPMMIWLVWRKRAIAARIGSAALRADAACSLTCAYMAAALLAGVALDTAFGWWWADSAAAFALLYWLVPETREALHAARTGERCDCCE